jgi:predicted unusual protein kinase regulating ubiquinone biosynthesis (AarF/ABC1/UbiB family)
VTSGANDTFHAERAGRASTVPFRSGAPATRPTARSEPADSPSPGVASRAWQVIRACWHHLFRPSRRTRPDRAERMRAFLEELGGTWVKLGQALALRFDLLPADYCMQFFRLLNQMRPFPAVAVRQVLERELGRPVEALFRSFEWQPLAAASIGQVHRAELPDGTAVAVKIQRPEIRALVRADLRLMRWMANVVDMIPFVGPIRARHLVREFARWTEEELDYRIEASHAAVLSDNAAGDPLEHNPRVFADYTTARVLTLEYLDGVPVIDVITAIRNRDAAYLDAFTARGHDPQRIASHIVWNALNQIYRFGYFHADPHPANLIVGADDTIGYVDFGIVGKLDAEMTDSLRYFAQSLFAGRIGTAVDEFMRFVTPTSGTDLAAARTDLIEALKSYVESERVGPGGFTSSDSVFEIEMLAIVRQHRMVLAPDVVRYLKAVLTAEAMVKELDPGFDLRAHENRFFGRLMQIELVEALHPGRVAQYLVDARFRVARLFESIESVRAAPERLTSVARNVRRRVQLLSVLTIVGWVTVLGALLAAGTGVTPFGVSPQSIGLAIGGVSLVLLLFSIVQVRRLPHETESDQRHRYPRRVR